jgi:hypothetical protein
MCFHVVLIVLVCASVCHKNDGAIDSVMCESFIEETNVAPTAVPDDCGDG